MAREFRVYGPPGTGKTTYIAEQSKNAAEKFGSSGVAIASLTRAAAAEIGSRVGTIPPQNVGTLHAFAWRALERPRIAESSEGLKAWNEAARSRADKIEGKAALNPENAPLEATLPATEAEELLGQLAVYRQRMMPPEVWPMRVRRFAQKWDDFKAHTGMIDFTDLIEKAYLEVALHPASPMAFFLDEAQDMSKLEMRLARKWGDACEVFVIVGDPYQNLYQWRGSDPEAFTAGEVEGVKVLGQSWRVPRIPQEYAVSFVKTITPQGETFPEYRPKIDAEGSLRTRPHTWAYPEALINDLLEDVDAGREAMVLATCGYMLTPLVATLRSRGIPFHNPYRIEHGGWNPLRYADRIRAYLKPQIEGAFWTWNELRLWIEPLKAQGLLQRGSKTWIEGKCEPQRFVDVQPADTIAPPSALEQIFVDEKVILDHVFEGDLDWYMANTRDSRTSVVEYACNVAKKLGPDALNVEPKLIVGTIHSVKGGEADSVYLFPDLSRRGFDAWNRHGASRDAIYRQFYVGMTRTKDRLTLLEPNAGEYVPLPRQ